MPGGGPWAGALHARQGAVVAGAGGAGAAGADCGACADLDGQVSSPPQGAGLAGPVGWLRRVWFRTGFGIQEEAGIVLVFRLRGVAYAMYLSWLR